MNKKIIGILVMMLLIGTVVLSANAENNVKDEIIYEKNIESLQGEVIDQEQYRNDCGYIMKGDLWGAQSFIPSIGELSSIELKMQRIGNPKYDIIVSLKKGNLYSDDLLTVAKGPDDIDESESWIKFDFEDINIETGKIYYITCTAQTGSYPNCYSWLCSKYNYYKYGSLYYGGKSWWNPVSDYDFCFRTYYHNDPPSIPEILESSTRCKLGMDYMFNTSTTDADPNDEIYYKWDWGNDNISDWIGPFNSEEISGTLHNWSEKGEYSVKVKAKDRYIESEWSEPLSISVPKNKAVNPFLLFLERLIEQFPILEQILQPIYDKLAGFY